VPQPTTLLEEEIYIFFFCRPVQDLQTSIVVFLRGFQNAMLKAAIEIQLHSSEVMFTEKID
jgi:hypothetical protein